MNKSITAIAALLILAGCQPDQDDKELSPPLATSEFRSALSWCSMVTDDGNNRSVKLESTGNILKLSAGGERKATASAPIKPSGPGTIQAAFDLHYLMALCDAMPNDMTLSYKDQLSPLMASSGKSRVVVMPMRIP